ncbi:glycosyltransferase family 4 protein [Acinetobacter lwoffii]|uniref:glycosyltransferase family 4 protein n=1 Tax=Acinetobacter lwoffii TaxID=28090 RepID=UPI00209B7F94|nr:glycosyltransferase family 4 protein [Acinetobacter lwoffii]MCO8061899.1 glycosyltransferase family 4 protein [Acinetobacter lwoffii]
MRKIFFIVSSLKNISGSERVACILANKLVEKLNYDVTILNRDANFGEVAYPLDSRVKVRKILGSQLSFYNSLVQEVKNNNPDTVVVHNMGKLSLLCSLIPKINKLVVLEHVSFISRPKLIQFLSKVLYKKIHQVVTLTQRDKLTFDDFHSNVTVIPNFSPFPIKINKEFGHKQIVSIGRLTDQKNYLHLLKAWEKIFYRLPEWKLCIYGEGEHKVLLADYIKVNKLPNVFLKGITSNVQDVYDSSDFFVMSSKYEGLPMVLIEAQSFGLPIVSYDCPNGPSDIIKDKVNGYLVEDQNIDQLADRILLLASSPLDLVKFSQNSLKNAENYQPEKILHLWSEQIFKG